MQPTVIQIPKDLLEDGASELELVSQKHSPQSSRHVHERRLSFRLSDAGSSSSRQLLHVSPRGTSLGMRVNGDGTATSMVMSMSDFDLKLNGNAGSDTISTKLVSLPSWVGLGNTKQSVFPARARDGTSSNMLRISIDPQPERVFSENPKAFPSYIERDTRFIRSTRLLAGSLTKEQQLEGLEQETVTLVTTMSEPSTGGNRIDYREEKSWVEFQSGYPQKPRTE